MFAAWYGQQLNNMARQREDLAAQKDTGAANAEGLAQGQRDATTQEDAARKELELRAQVAGGQSEELGEPQPVLSEPGMRVAAQQGAKGNIIERIKAARAQRGKMDLAQLATQGKIAHQQVTNAGDLQEAEVRAGAQREVGAGSAASRVQGAEISADARRDAATIMANRPNMAIATKTTQAANAASDTLAKINKIEALTGGDYTKFLTWRAKFSGFVGGIKDMAGMKMSPDQQMGYNAQALFETLTAMTNVEEMHRLFGSATTATEVVRGAKAVLNAESMGPTRFRIALGEFKDTLTRVQLRAPQASTSTSISLGGSAVPAGEVTLIGPNGEQGTAPGGPALQAWLKNNPGWRAQ
mgnify:FL=1